MFGPRCALPSVISSFNFAIVLQREREREREMSAPLPSCRMWLLVFYVFLAVSLVGLGLNQPAKLQRVKVLRVES